MKAAELVQLFAPTPAQSPGRVWDGHAVVTGLVLVVFAFLFACYSVKASTPSIYLIEPYRTSQVLVHFFTDPDRTYELQYSNTVSNGSPSGWTTLYTAPSLPFPSHYIIVDTRTDQFRFYRLKVSP